MVFGSPSSRGREVSPTGPDSGRSRFDQHAPGTPVPARVRPARRILPPAKRSEGQRNDEGDATHRLIGGNHRRHDQLGTMAMRCSSRRRKRAAASAIASTASSRRSAAPGARTSGRRANADAPRSNACDADHDEAGTTAAAAEDPATPPRTPAPSHAPPRARRRAPRPASTRRSKQLRNYRITLVGLDGTFVTQGTNLAVQLVPRRTGFVADNRLLVAIRQLADQLLHRLTDELSISPRYRISSSRPTPRPPTTAAVPSIC
jgi:hypothetical protein